MEPTLNMASLLSDVALPMYLWSMWADLWLDSIIKSWLLPPFRSPWVSAPLRIEWPESLGSTKFLRQVIT